MAPKLPADAFKGAGMRVFISAFKGLYPIEVGIAYWHRGHYIYSVAGMPVEPVQFATKKGINIVPADPDSAPPLVRSNPLEHDEHTVAALRLSMVNEWERQKRIKEGEVEVLAVAVTKADEKDKDKQQSETPKATAAILAAAETDSPAPDSDPDSESRIADLKPRKSIWFDIPEGESDPESKYNNRARYLAQSTPGSHFVTPDISRSNTPSDVGSSAYYRPTVPSGSRVSKLLKENDVGQAAGDESKSQSLPMSRSTSAIGLFNDLRRHASRDSSVGNRSSSSSASIHKDIPSPSVVRIRKEREKKAATTTKQTKPRGRARADSMKKASLALNATDNEKEREKKASGTIKPGASQPSKPRGRARADTVRKATTPAPPAAVNVTKANNDEFVIVVNLGGFQHTPTTPQSPSESPTQPPSAAPRVTKCPIHGDPCDGVTTTNDYPSLHAMKTSGFKELYPVVENNGRKMVDWKLLYEQEKNGANEGVVFGEAWAVEGVSAFGRERFGVERDGI